AGPVTLPVTILPPRLTTAMALHYARQATQTLDAALQARAHLTAQTRLTARVAARRTRQAEARRAHLLLLTAGERARMAQAFADLATRAKKLPALSVGGRLYHVPPAMAQALLRVVPASPTPRVVLSPAGVQRYVAALAVQLQRSP